MDEVQMRLPGGLRHWGLDAGPRRPERIRGPLTLGYYEQGKLRYASKAGTGFSNALIRQLIEAGELLRQPQSPFVHLLHSDGSSWAVGLTAAERRTAVWLKPVLACCVRFTEWTRDGHMRHPCFEGTVT